MRIRIYLMIFFLYSHSQLKRGVIRVKSDFASPRSPSEGAESSSTNTCFGKDSRNEKMDVKTQQLSPSASPLPLSSGSPRTSPAPTSAEPLQDNGNYASYMLILCIAPQLSVYAFSPEKERKGNLYIFCFFDAMTWWVS